MDGIIEEFEKYISSNKEVLEVLPINTKKNRAKYVEKVDEFLEGANQINKVIWNEISDRYNRLIDVKQGPKIAELEKTIDSIQDVDLFNELNTPYEKLKINRIVHNLNSYFEGNLEYVNKNIKEFINIFADYGVALTASDFNYSDYANQYMIVFFEETANGALNSEKLEKTFENIYWKCPDIVIHIELNMRYLYYLNEKKITKQLEDRNEAILQAAGLDKNGLVKRYFELNRELIKTRRLDAKYLTDKFISGEWKSKDFNQKEMENLYNKMCSVDYYSLSNDKQDEMNNNFGKLLNTLQEFNIYQRYEYIIKDLEEKRNNKDGYKQAYDDKVKELRKKEALMLKYNQENKKLIKYSKNSFFRFFKKKFERKIYDFPVAQNLRIRELKALYEELDEATVNLRVAEYIDDTCTLKYMFKIATSFYSYAFNLVKEEFKEEIDVDVTSELQFLIDFIDQPYKEMLNNIKLIEKPELTSIIANRYKILNINIEKVDLEESLEEITNAVEKIVNFSNIQRGDINMSDIEYIEKVGPMLNK